MYFRKLKKGIGIPEYQTGQLAANYGDFARYFEVLSETQAFAVIPERYRPGFSLYSLEFTNSIMPHTDSDGITKVNFYIDTGNFVTKYWKVIDWAESGRVTNSDTKGMVFRYQSLEYVESFYAFPGDAYVLNTAQPHSVTPPSGHVVFENPELKAVRRLLSLQTNIYDYDQVLAMLSETGYL